MEQIYVEIKEKSILLYRFIDYSNLMHLTRICHRGLLYLHLAH